MFCHCALQKLAANDVLRPAGTRTEPAGATP